MTELNSTERWCLGAPQSGTSKMAKAELSNHRSDVRNALMQAAGLLVVSLSVPVGLAVASLYLKLWSPLGIALLVMSPIGCAAGIMTAIDRIRRAQCLRRELRDPELAVFETVLDDKDVKDVALVLGLKQPPARGAFSFEVAVASGRLHSVAGKPPSGFMRLTIQLVAKRPKIMLDQGETHSLVRERSLSAEECDELRRRARDAWLAPLRSASGWLVLGMVAVLSGPVLYRRAWWNALPAAAFASFAIISAVPLLRGLQRARRLRADLKAGVVAVTQSDPKSTPGSEHAALEVLTNTDELWTLADEPANWRTSSLVKRR